MKPFALTYPDTNSASYTKARYHYLLQIIFGETMAVDYCRTIASFAPSDSARSFLLQQQIEEDTHLEMLTEYVGTHPRPEALISPSLKKLHLIMKDTLIKKDYVAAVFVQNFIVEGLNVSLLRELEHHSDGNLSELCTKILRDEVRHMDFGVTEIEKILNEAKDSKTRKRLIKKLIWLQRKTLFYSVGLVLALVREAKDLGIPMKEFGHKAVQEHFDRIQKSGIPLPWIDTIAFNCVMVFLKLL